MKKVWNFIFGSATRTGSLPRAEDESRRMEPIRRLVFHSQGCDR